MIIQLTCYATTAIVLLASATTAQAQSHPNLSDNGGTNVSDIGGPNVSDITGTETASSRAQQAGLDEEAVAKLADDIEAASADCSNGGDCATLSALVNQAQDILQPE